jgi:hypothetical protein
MPGAQFLPSPGSSSPGIKGSRCEPSEATSTIMSRGVRTSFSSCRVSRETRASVPASTTQNRTLAPPGAASRLIVIVGDNSIGPSSKRSRSLRLRSATHATLRATAESLPPVRCSPSRPPIAKTNPDGPAPSPIRADPDGPSCQNPPPGTTPLSTTGARSRPAGFNYCAVGVSWDAMHGSLVDTA